MGADSAENLLRGAYMAQVESRGREFKADEETAAHLRALAEALTAKPPKCGFALCGPCGNGKSTTVAALQAAINFLHGTQGMTTLVTVRDGLRIVAAKELARLARTDDARFKAEADAPLLAIEDVGEEPAEVSTYGNILSPVADVIERRYDRQLFTAMTTNLTPQMLSEKYGARVADRFREMLTVIPFKNGSYRN